MAPDACRLFVVDSAKALSRVIRPAIGAETPIQRCEIPEGRTNPERVSAHFHADVRSVLRQAREREDPQQAERLLRDLARRLKPDAPGVSGAIREGLDGILTFPRLQLPSEPHPSPACTNMIERVFSVVHRVRRNVNR